MPRCALSYFVACLFNEAKINVAQPSCVVPGNCVCHVVRGDRYDRVAARLGAGVYGDDRPVDFDFFYGQLIPYGNWFEAERWGYVWQPADVDPDFRPYYDGHWIYTARHGWYWVRGDKQDENAVLPR